jgi:hypothetical protein
MREWYLEAGLGRRHKDAGIHGVKVGPHPIDWIEVDLFDTGKIGDQAAETLNLDRQRIRSMPG